MHSRRIYRFPSHLIPPHPHPEMCIIPRLIWEFRALGFYLAQASGSRSLCISARITIGIYAFNMGQVVHTYRQ